MFAFSCSIALAQRSAAFILTADRPDSIYISFNREPVFNESLMGDAFTTIQVQPDPVVIKFDNVTKLSRLSVTSYSWTGNFIGTDWIVEPGDSVHIHINFQTTNPSVNFKGHGSAKYKLAFETRKLDEQIRATEFEVYDNVKSHDQAYRDVDSIELQYLNKVKAKRKSLSPHVYRTWVADIQNIADFSRLRIQSHQWTVDPKARQTIHKRLFETPDNIDPTIGLVSRALIKYRYERIKWLTLSARDENYKYYDVQFTEKITFKEIFFELKKQPDPDREFLMVFSLLNLHENQMTFGETAPDVLETCLSFAEETISNAYLKKILDQFSKRVRPGSVVSTLVTIKENGDTLKLSDFRGKKVILDRWVADCAPCLKFKSDLINNILPALKGRNDIVIWSVGSVRDFELWKKLLHRNSHPDFISSWLNGGNSSNSWEAEYKISVSPFIMIIDEDGKLISSTVQKTETIMAILGIPKM
ncbi:MAG TPA: hypothetical protein PKJ63_00635 [Cyclobacteriaceae bacterium]|nr:hypothetical protein [Cyclobacteriaceae bacterium]